MKLPSVGATFGAPVPDIRRANVGPEVYDRRMRAVQGLIDAGSGLAKEVYDRDQESKYTAASGDAALQLQELRARLNSAKTLNIDEIPSDIEIDDADIIQTEDGEQFVPTFKVAKKIWDTESERIITSSGSKIKSRPFRERYTVELNNIRAQGGVELIQAAYKQQQEFGAVQLVDSLEKFVAVAAADPEREQDIHGAIARQVALGTIDPQKGVELSAEYMAKVDTTRMTTRMLSLNTPEDRAQFRQDLWTDTNLRIPTEGRLALDKEMDRMENEARRATDARHRKGYSTLFNEYVGGVLSLRRVDEALQADEIGQEEANTFRAMVEARQNRIDDQNKAYGADARKDYFKGIIAQAGFAGDAGSVAANFKMVRQMIAQAVAGVDRSGEPLDPSVVIDGAMALELLRDAELAETRAIRGPQYSEATQLIRTYTGVTPGVDGTMTGTAGQRDSFASFLSALNAYVDREGINADPVKFVRDNVKYFDPQEERKKAATQFFNRYPDLVQFYQTPAKNLPTGSTYEERRGKVRRGSMLRYVNDKYLKSSDPAFRAQGLQILREYLATFEDRGFVDNDPRLMLREMQSTIMTIQGMNDPVKDADNVE